MANLNDKMKGGFMDLIKKFFASIFTSDKAEK